MTRPIVRLAWPITAAAALLLFCWPAAAGDILLDAGRLLRELHLAPPAPVPGPAPETVLPASPEAAARPGGDGGKAAASASFILKDVRFSGNCLVAEADLRRAALPFIGQTLDMEGIRKLAAGLTEVYRQAGFPLSRAVVERQKVTDGVVSVRLVEAKYQGVRIKNESRLRPGLAEGIIAGKGGRRGGVRAGGEVEQRELRRRMRLLSSLPGVKVGSSFQPPAKEEEAAPGRTWLEVGVEDARRLRVGLDADNNGEEAIGRHRLWTRFALDNAAGLGDKASLDILLSEEMAAWFRASWEFALGSEGGRLGASVSRMDYTLAGPVYKAMGAKGLSNTASLWYSRPLAMSDRHGVSLRAQFDLKDLKDSYESFNLAIRKRVALAAFSLSGWHVDKLGIGPARGGVNTWSLAAAPGLYRPLGEEWRNDALAQRARGGFVSLSASLARDQRLWGGGDSAWGGVLRLSARGQWSPFKNLNSSEQFSLGGASGVRGYPVGEQSGDSGLLLRGEYRQTLPRGFTIFAGADWGWVRMRTRDYDPAAANYRSLSSAALGLGWNRDSRASVEAVAAWRLDGPARGGRDLRPRLWLNTSFSF